MSKFRSVDEYVGAQPEAVQAILARVRSAIREALPAADETISYNMPTYSLGGGVILHFAAWKKHFSLYPASAKLIAFFKQDLDDATIDKSTIRFPLAEPVPARLIGRIAKFRVKELAERAKAKKTYMQTPEDRS